MGPPQSLCFLSGGSVFGHLPLHIRAESVKGDCPHNQIQEALCKTAVYLLDNGKSLVETEIPRARKKRDRHNGEDKKI